MHIVTVGINYRTAPVEIREKFSISKDQLEAAITQLMRTQGVRECVVIATCNRTEIYAVVDRRPHICGYYIREFMSSWFRLPMDEFNSYLYIYENDKAIDHLFRVVCGLDSMVIGETQIIGQVRTAFLTSQRLKATGTRFNQLFKQAITLAKRAHSDTAIGENAVSISYAAVELSKRIFDDLTDKSVMVIGAGKMSELTLKHLYSQGVQRVIVANRTLVNAHTLSERFNGIACTFEQVDEYIHDIDILISSTGASGHLITRERMVKTMNERKARPIFMIDIAVPRDLDPSMADIAGVFLYNIDDLEGIVESNLAQRTEEAILIEKMIDNEKNEFKQWSRIIGIGPVIHALQEKTDRVHEDTLMSLFNKLPNLSERERSVIQKLTKSMLNQLNQDPIQQMKIVASQQAGNEVIEMFTKLHALDKWMEQHADRSEHNTSFDVMSVGLR